MKDDWRNQCLSCKKNATLVFTYPECDLVCGACGMVQYARANAVYVVDQHIKRSTRMSDLGTDHAQDIKKPTTFHYSPAVDDCIDRLTRLGDSYVHIYHVFELLAVHERPPLPKAACKKILAAAKVYEYSTKQQLHTRTDFCHRDAKTLCVIAATSMEQKYERQCRRLPRPSKGEKEIVNPHRLLSYAERWVQIWKLLVGKQKLNPTIHPIIPWCLEEKARVRAHALVQVWVRHLHYPKGADPAEYHPLATQNCRYALFLRAIYYIEKARSSIRRSFSLAGINAEKWYERLKYLWPFLREEGSIIYLSSDDDTLWIEWPTDPPPFSKLIKEGRDFSKVNPETGICYGDDSKHIRWYETQENAAPHERILFAEKESVRKKRSIQNLKFS